MGGCGGRVWIGNCMDTSGKIDKSILEKCRENEAVEEGECDFNTIGLTGKNI